MRKIRGRELMPYVFLGVLTVIGCWCCAGKGGVFGVKVDWLSQHSVLPDYFRQQFYETGKLFPEFAGNLGGGQNIYHFSYYGLYSPIFLLSYLLPFVKMGDYLMAVSATGIFASAGLLYYWLGRRGFSWEISLPVSVLFLFAGPVIFQSCHQVMFINYMPFLIMAFVGEDRYFEKGKSGLYTVSVFLMILTSFYFSIGGMLVLALYGLSRYVERKSRAAFLLPMITAVFMSGFLLVPTVCAIFGKREGSADIDVWELLMPRFPLESLVHGPYGIGLTTGIITILLTGLFYRKWSERLLHGGCLIIFILPVFCWLLNGGLYVRGKALIPFLPLLCYLTAVYLEKLRLKETSFAVNIAAYLFTIGWLFAGHFFGKEFSGEPSKWYLLLIESSLLFACLCIYRRQRSLLLLVVPPILCLLLGGRDNSFINRDTDEMLDKQTYAKVTDIRIGKLASRALEEEEGFWRLEQAGDEEEKSADLNRIWNNRQWISSLYSSAYNAEYQSFREDIFGVEKPFRNNLMQTASDNPLYQKLMGVKYVIGDVQHEKAMASAGYKRYLAEGEYVVYRSGNTAPIAYASDKVLGEQEYDSLDFPFSQTALMEYAVVTDSRKQDTSWKAEMKAGIVPVELSIPDTNREDLAVKRTSGGAYHIQAEKKGRVMCKIDVPNGAMVFETEKGGLLFLRFRLDNHCKNKDAAVWLNETRNKLSAANHVYYNGNTVFTYVVPLEAGASEISLDFGKGDYEILDMECFLGDGSLLEDSGKPGERLYQSPFEVNWDETKGNLISGKIQVQNTGYFITSIPYDDGFEIFVDGKRTKPERVNKAFLGCSIKKGEHQIKMIYHAPGLDLGKAAACIGALFFILMLAAEKYRAIITTG